jgi:hypothetical protein
VNLSWPAVGAAGTHDLEAEYRTAEFVAGVVDGDVVDHGDAAVRHRVLRSVTAWISMRGIGADDSTAASDSGLGWRP